MVRQEAGADLIARARHDRAAFGELYHVYVRGVYAFCYAHSGNQQDAEDLTAQTFERALGAIGRYEDRGVPFSAWLLRIAAHAAADRGRRGGREVLLGDTSPPEPDPARLAPPGPDGLVERWERVAGLRAHLDTLPADQRRAVRLRYSDDCSLRDMAERMGRSEGAVQQLLQRALRALRGRIPEEGRGDV